VPKKKDTPKKENFMDELENTSEIPDNCHEEDKGEKEEAKEMDLPEQSVKSKKGLSTVPMSLKRIRKIVEEVNLNNISVADKFDLRMTSGYIDFLKETIDNMLEEIK